MEFLGGALALLLNVWDWISEHWPLLLSLYAISTLDGVRGELRSVNDRLHRIELLLQEPPRPYS